MPCNNLFFIPEESWSWKFWFLISCRKHNINIRRIVLYIHSYPLCLIFSFWKREKDKSSIQSTLRSTYDDYERLFCVLVFLFTLFLFLLFLFLFTESSRTRLSLRSMKLPRSWLSCHTLRLLPACKTLHHFTSSFWQVCIMLAFTWHSFSRQGCK